MKIKHLLSVLLLSLLLSLDCWSQPDNSIRITGTITSCNTEKPIYRGIVVYLKMKNGIEVGSPVDSTGRYTIFSDVRTIKQGCLLSAIQKFPEMRQVHKDFSPIEFHPYISSQYVKITPLFKDTIRQDFCLQKMLFCGYSIPSILFKRNSIEFFTDSNTNSLESLKRFRCWILEKQYKMEISAHAGKSERRAKHLSLQRGEYIKTELVKLGVPDSMLIVKAYGKKYPFEAIDEVGKIKEMKTKAEKEYVKIHSRRVAFASLRRYDETNW